MNAVLSLSFAGAGAESDDRKSDNAGPGQYEGLSSTSGAARSGSRHSACSPRGGARGPGIRDGSVGSPACLRIRASAPGSVTAATTRMRPPQRGHSSDRRERPAQEVRPRMTVLWITGRRIGARTERSAPTAARARGALRGREDAPRSRTSGGQGTRDRSRVACKKTGPAALAAVVAGDPDESVGQDAAPEERLTLVDHEARKAGTARVPRLGLGQKGPPVVREQFVEDRLLGPMRGRRIAPAQRFARLGERGSGRHPWSSVAALRPFLKRCLAWALPVGRRGERGGRRWRTRRRRHEKLRPIQRLDPGRPRELSPASWRRSGRPRR